ncbi:hypothetical protein B9Q04_06815 [Candidatus Marsarchaeota G2 archaeon BE_D]|uniref:Uncharacterized protein n=1 Tax=Candidatus Marsarchaeota G2 archaeon BE_D TaxID=1978158 RepID=A0A2R6CBB8_9ARCH|nr:MAG: hypothetical protein B9Q04_06815 [Candidatus Marsarchaeota G2 archaeon BE_D]
MVGIISYLKPNKRFSERLNKALKHGKFTEEEKVITRGRPNPVTLEVMEEYGVTRWSPELEKKVSVCEKLLIRGVLEDNVQLAAIAYECLKVLAYAENKVAKKIEEEPKGVIQIDV